MESVQSNQENSSDKVNQQYDQQQQVIGGSQVIRSYECTFCKRGFSNAQALGGHMNIHRKDKAKLRHHSTSTELPHQYHQQSSLDMISKNIFMEAKFSEDDRSSSMTIYPWVNLDKESDRTSVKNKRHVGEIQQLSLFVDKPSGKEDQDHHQHQQEQETRTFHGSIEKGLLSSHGWSISELDLELRLGPEPQDSSPATGTKSFF